MIYSQLTRKALEIATKAHEGQVDKAGVAYLLHPVHLAEQMGNDHIATVVALLHDVVEDSDYTVEDLVEAGFQYEVTSAVDLLTHKDGVPYMDYIAAIKENPIARKVKLADLRHNSDLHRLGTVDDGAEERFEKYQKAIDILESDFRVYDDMSDFELVCFKKHRRRVYRDKVRGSMLGSAIGDALGYPVEFLRRKDIRTKYGEDGITAYQLTDGKAVISDDTQMAMFTAVGLLKADTAWQVGEEYDLSIRYVYRAYLDWFETQNGASFKETDSWICYKCPELFHRRAPGNTCLSALESGQIGNIIAPINNSKGCGGIMRVHPVALAAGPDADIKSVDSLAADIAALTHGHQLGWLPAAAFAHIVYRLVYGGCRYSDTPGGILTECKEMLSELYGKCSELKTLFSCIDKACELAKRDLPDYANIAELGEGWVAEETLAIAIYCWLRYPTDFDKAITAAVNHNGDSDSTGAVIGAILGATVGYSEIDDKWKDKLELRDVLLELSDDLCDGCQMNEALDYVDNDWLSKYGSVD